MKQFWEDNRGLSLIEVLVAMVLLSIVVIPFLHAFITAANTNNKAKEIHRATIVAQSVMEGFKAETLEDIAVQFDYPQKGFRVVAPERIGDGTDLTVRVQELRYNSVENAYQSVLGYESPLIADETDKKSFVTASIYSEDMGENTEFLGQSDGKYFFSIENVKEDTALYDVLVNLDANPYRGAAGVTEHQYNADELAKLPVLDEEKDAVCIQREAYNANALAEFQSAHPEMSEENIAQKMKKTITVTVERTRVGAGAFRVRVLAEYHYTFQKSGIEPVIEYVKTQTCFDSTEADQELRNVYLYYLPLYSDAVARDEIVFENMAGIPVNFYLFKQDTAETSVEADNRYRMKLAFKEPIGATASTMATELHTNLISLVDMSACSVFLNGSSVALDQVASDEILEADSLDRVFDVEVNVYKKGAKDAGYPQDMHLATLTGSKVN